MSTWKQPITVNSTFHLEKEHDIVFLEVSGKGYDITLPLIDDNDIKNGKQILFFDQGGGGLNPVAPIRILPNPGDGSVIGFEALTEFSFYQSYQFVKAYPILQAGKFGYRWIMVQDDRIQHQNMFHNPVADSSILAVSAGNKTRIVIPHKYDSWFVHEFNASALGQTGGTGSLKIDLTKNTASVAGSTVVIPAGNLFGYNDVLSSGLHEQVNEGDQMDVAVTSIVAGGGGHKGLFWSIILKPY